MCGNAGIVVTNLGTTLAFFECPKKRWADDGNWQDIVVKRSEDSGRTWSPNILVHSESGPDHGNATVTIGNAAPVFDAVTNKTVVLMCRNNSEILVSTSANDGRTWSVARDITAEAKPDHLQWGWIATTFSGIQLRHSRHAGRLLFCADHIEGQWTAYPAVIHASHVIISDDGGSTFRVGGTLNETLTTDECAIAELSDGTVLMNSRNCYGNLGPHKDCDGSNASLRALTNSSTGGESWGATSFSADLPEPVCEGSMIAPRDGLLLFSNPTSFTERGNGSVHASTDGGRRWQKILQVTEADEAFEYSSLVALPDGTIGLIWDDKGTPVAHPGIPAQQSFIAFKLGAPPTRPLSVHQP